MINKRIVVLFISLACFIETAGASTTHTVENVLVELYDAAGNKSVYNDPLFGDLDLIAGTGYLVADIQFSGVQLLADITHINEWSGVSGSGDVNNYRFEWTTETWFIDTRAVTCNISSNLDGCSDERNSNGQFISSEVSFYEYSLSEGQFSWESFLDWSVNEDIPILTVLEVTSTDIDGAMTFITVDSDGDGVPGSAMLDCSGCGPFPGQTLVFSGVLVPVAAIPLPASIWLFGSGLVALFGIRRRKSI